MDGRPTWTDCDEAGDYVVPNVLSPRDLVFRPDNMDETVPHTHQQQHTTKVRIWRHEADISRLIKELFSSFQIFEEKML